MEMKNLGYMKVMVILMVVGAFGMIPRIFEIILEDLEIWGRIEMIKTTALLRSDKILRRGDLVVVTQTSLKNCP